MSAIKRCAPAKINLNLHIICQRQDGYHELSTRMQKVDLCDWVTVEKLPGEGVSFNCSESSVPDDETNLAVKAARLFLAETGKVKEFAVSIKLIKNIPVAAGLGGGSSDAGTVLKMLNELCEFPCSQEQLIGLGKQLGADVPFFVTEKSAVVAEGIGERMVEATDLRGYWILLANPPVKVSTRWAFENYALTSTRKTSKISGFQNSDSGAFSLDQMHNDLEQVTEKRYPVVDSLKRNLIDNGASAAMMSGSGPTVFGLFPENDRSEKDKYRLVEEISSIYGCRAYAVGIYTGA